LFEKVGILFFIKDGLNSCQFLALLNDTGILLID
jgi:hypothetical protein